MTRMTDLIHNSKSVVAIGAESVAEAGAVAGEVIDTLGFYALLLTVICGAEGGATLEVKQADDEEMTGAEVVPASNIIGGAEVEADSVGVLNVVPTKRYVQLTATTAEADTVIGAVANLFGADINGKINE